VFLLAALLDALLVMLWIRVGQAMVNDLARDLFARVQRRPLLKHHSTPIGETMERVGADSWCVHTVVDELVFTPAHVLVTIAAIVVVMLSLNAGLTALVLAILPLMALASLLLGRMTREAAQAEREVEGQISAHVHQTLTGISVVQGFGREVSHHRRFEELARTAIRARMRVALTGSANELSSGLVTAIGTGAVLLLAANAVLEHKLSTGGLLVFVAYMTTLQGQLGGITGIYTKLQGVRPSIDRAVDVLDQSHDVRSLPAARALRDVRGEVSYEAVSFAYQPQRPVLEDVSFHLRAGDVVALVGPTGAGKSTLAGLLPRFFDPDSGAVLIDGHDLRELELASVRGAVSLVLQESFLFPVSIGENIAYGRTGASREQIEQAARAANAHEFISRLPDGYDTVVGERGTTLSGGERQRVAIARALLKNAPILVLDEPTSALDAHTEHELMGALENLMSGRTTLIIAHRLSTIKRADSILVLDAGRLVEQGSHAELVRGEGVYARLHALQLGREGRESAAPVLPIGAPA
jgi:ATP-binding cassette subfamily B protein/subfamily B ATP-binding cassette protein MsbA